MKSSSIVLTLLTLFELGLGAPKPTKVNFRNLFRKPMVDNVSPRIVNGGVAPPHTIPYQAYIEIYGETVGGFCGGSLIASNIILTAAHCIVDANEVRVVLGAVKPAEAEDDQVSFVSTDLIPHENYTQSQLYYDIALIRLQEDAKINENIQIIPLPSDVTESYANKIGKASGWGLTSSGGTASEELKYYEDVIISNEKCSTFYRQTIQELAICLSGDGGNSVCTGDSGGPLAVDGVQVGVCSFVEANCTPGYPGGFTRVSQFLDWISQHI